RPAVALTVNDWNRERIWPKAYLREEEGQLALYSEVSADLEPGATDVQRAQLIACGLGTGVQMFSALEGMLPEPGAAAEPPDVPDH
ncbi:YbjN domain-containing protein, partial [Listeria monocytogenes]|nr:YbjN domain-containing protein [Listeria monocytogenes]